MCDSVEYNEDNCGSSLTTEQTSTVFPTCQQGTSTPAEAPAAAVRQVNVGKLKGNSLSGQNNPWMWVAIGGGVLAVIILGGMLMKKKKGAMVTV